MLNNAILFVRKKANPYWMTLNSGVMIKSLKQPKTASWVMNQNPRGADASAILYSLVQTAKANNLETFAFLTYILTELPKLGRHYDEEALEQFMPWNLTEKIQPLNKVA